ncbi:amidohydrolase family protein, partial [Enterovibrio norvegicus]
MATTWIKHPLAIWTGTENDAAGGIVVDGANIVEVISRDGQPSVAIDHVVDASQHVVLPGLINAHHHFYQTLTRAYPDALDKELFNWLKALYPVWACLDEEMMQLSTELASAELLLSGCTTASDHHYLIPTGLEHAIDVQIEATQKMGIRTVLTRGSMSLGEDQGGLPPRHTIQTEQTIIDDSIRLINR